MSASDILFSNFAEAKLSTPPSGTSGLTFSVQAGQGAEYPAPTGGKYFYGIFTNSGKTVFEIVKITARSADSFTIAGGGRGLDGTTAQTWTANDYFYYGLTNATLAEFFGHVTQASAAHAASAVSNTPAGGVAAADVQAAINELDTEKLDKAGGTVTGNLTVNGTLSGSGALTTGDVKATFKTSETGWVLMNDGSIGNASSGATARANADTEALFTLLWNNIINQWCPVQDSTGAFVARGGSAAADFAANRRVVLPKMLGRALASAGLGSFTSLFTANAGTDELTIDSNSSLYTGAVFRVANTGGALPGGLVPLTDYYAIRTSATVIKVASSLANAHAGTAIDITSAGSGVHTLTMSLTNRVLGEHAGEEAHNQTGSEVGLHSHPITDPGHIHALGLPGFPGVEVPNLDGNGGSGDNYNSLSAVTGISVNNNTGGGNPANIMQPSSFLNVMIKL